jgi:hypothetical protein
MGQGKETILFLNREVVAGVILMVMSIDNKFRMKGIQELQKSIPTKGKTRIDQESIDKKGIDLVNRKT